MSAGAPAVELPPGFELLEQIACGPFSEVWRGVDGDGEAVAVKLPRGEHGARMLAEEARVAQRLRRVCRVRDYVPGERPALVLDWIGRRTFRDVLRDAETPDDRAHALRLFLQLLDTVRYVHAQGVVHGDLKPENALIDDATGEAVLIDFGLARGIRSLRLDRSLRQSLDTRDELAGGTLAYLPPEAVKGGEPSYQGDVYTLGVMLHEVLLGRRPDKATRPEALRAHLPDGAVDALLKALAFEPGDRFRRAGGLLSALQPVVPELTATGLRRRRHQATRFVLGGLAAFFVALRYTAVACLLATYLGIAIAALHEPPKSLVLLVVLVPFLALHGVIRWEGPESQEEAAARQQRAAFQ